ncbi:group-specific protein [Lysinibacillus odysseyi]|uniref:Group-specific protein n=1 Tax=Lysinibacillus odysseyi 34hs-1 = NBRC 100172 TaxID=1220589 RepID=A0A0A3IXD1_9BACI|nr:group-specific protein [Lysinibacillus odysseyi]KGR87553.1 hypothetical protein CD32_03100 [Lysinibacillus odysseyi 34hs-1 = NBRC 100172]
MFQVQIDEEKVEKLYLDALHKKMEEIEESKVFWDTRELKRRTCMSWNTIQEHFFHDPRFPKVKLGGKWFYPAKETETFLNQWLKEKRGVSS